MTFPRARTHHNTAMVSAFLQGFTKARKRNGGAISKGTMVSASSKTPRHHHNRSNEENAALLSKPPQQNTPSGPKARRKRSPQRAESPTEARNGGESGRIRQSRMKTERTDSLDLPVFVSITKARWHRIFHKASQTRKESTAQNRS